MVRQDILGGLRVAMQSGDSLRDAMMSFYLAGYQKQDIEEAARALQQQGGIQAIQTSNKKQEENKHEQKNLVQEMKKLDSKTSLKKFTPLKQNKIEIKNLQNKKPEIKQKVSSYGENKTTSKNKFSYKPNSKKDKVVIVLLIVLGIILLGLIGIFFLYKPAIIEFFNKLMP